MPAPPTDPTSPPGGPPTTGRRRVLGAGAAIGLVALTSACRVRDPFGDTPSAGASATAPTGERDDRSATQDADLALATTTSGELRALQAAAAATASRFPGLRSPITPFADLHRAHLGVLARADRSGSSAAPTPAAYAVPAERQQAWQALLGLERASVARLAEHAVAARSGAFARLLAGMSAATAQRLAVAGAAT